MRQVLALCTALAFTLSLAGAVFAQGTTSPGTAPSGSSATSPSSSAPDTTKSTAPKATGTDTQKSTTGAAGKSDTKSEADKGMAGKDKAGAGKTAGGFRGVHTMKGEITKIDQAKGMYTFKSEDGMALDLHAPPSALQGMKEGDRVEVQLGLRPASAAGAGSMSGTSGTAPSAQSGKSPAAPSAQPVPPGKQSGDVTKPAGSGSPGSPKQ